MTDQQPHDLGDLTSEAHRQFYRNIRTPYGWGSTNPTPTDTEASDDQD